MRSWCDDDMMILPILSSKESAAFRARRFGGRGLRDPGPRFMRVWLYSHNRRTRGERGQSGTFVRPPRTHAVCAHGAPLSGISHK